MKLTHTVLAAALASAMVLSLAACSGSGNSGQSAANKAPGAASTAAATMPMNSSSSSSMKTGAAAASTAARIQPTSPMSTAMAMKSTAKSWFGGPIYTGKPDLAVTAALVKAGGGANDFKFSTALDSMLGKKTVNTVIKKLTKQYGQQDVHNFITGATFVVKDGLKQATNAGIKLPPPANLQGKALAKKLIKEGTAPDGTFWAGYLLDHILSHKIHDQVMADVDAKDGHKVDGNVHKILNQAMYDVAQKLGMKNVKLASFH